MLLEIGTIEAIGFTIPIIVLAFSIYKFGKEQKQNHKIQQNTQKQYNEIQEKSKNLEFMKQLESYSTEFIDLKHTLLDGPAKYAECERSAKMYLSILDRLSFFQIKSLTSQDTIEFFHNDFGAGITLLKWLKLTNTEPGSWSEAYPNFVKLSRELKLPEITISHPFYYYVNEFQNSWKNNSHYNPYEDQINPKTYKIKEENIIVLEKYDK